ncbi:diguanylate cyclase domain-containing protein [Oleidesulfovibrio sp.]|uniref:GGDEF domain-containing response regulator n=1 Tax=Oleidesulfovibrio sp. TaxID=2909707 RepID=UPI003A8886B2
MPHIGNGLAGRRLRAFLVTCEPSVLDMVSALWPEEVMAWTSFECGAVALESIFSDPPDLVLVDMVLADMQGTDLVRMVKSENVYRQVPVILCLEHQTLQGGFDWSEVEADDFLVRPLIPEVVKARVDLTMNRASRSLDANPLTRLPGNTSIIHFIQEQIDRKADFAFGYADLDHFKSFNDKYGFSRGDEALMMTARIIVNIIKSYTGTVSFVGHVGGDDFVFGLPLDLIEGACQRIVTSFDSIVPHFYDEKDREQGGIVSTDRRGEIQSFPLMAISIAVVVNVNGKLEHFGEVSAIASTLKKKAKEDPRSNYVMDRRRT